MNLILEKPSFTPEDLLKMPDGDRFELVNGKLLDRDMGAKASHIGGRLHHILYAYCEKNPLGLANPADCTYQCFPDAPNKVRKPDVSFIRFGRLPEDILPEGHIRIAPDLAVEVPSPNDLYYEVDQRVEDFLRAGVRLVWVVSPESRTVLVYRANGTIYGLREPDELTGEDVLPDFRVRVEEIFRIPTPPRPAESTPS